MTPAKATPAKASAKDAPKPSAKSAQSRQRGANSADKPAAKNVEKAKAGHIFIGIGGWTFAPWRGAVYPKGLAHAKEVSYASERLTSIEVNGTFYRSQTPATFRKWASEVPDGFVFALKGPRFATNRRVLAEAGGYIKRFYDSGVLELGDQRGA